MKPYMWFMIGIVLLIADLTHAFLTSFFILHYIIIAVSFFFIISAFIIAGAKEDLYPTLTETLTSSPLDEKKTSKKLIIYIILMALMVAGYFLFKDSVVSFVKSYPWLWNIVTYVDAQIQRRTLLGLFYAAFFGGLFFSPIAVELIFIYYLTLDYSPLTLLAVMLLGGILAEIVNYFFGFTLGNVIVKPFMKDSLEKWKTRSEKYGSFLVFAASALPLPLGIIALILGALKFNIGKFSVAVILGRLARYASIIWLQAFFVTTILPFFRSLF